MGWVNYSRTGIVAAGAQAAVIVNDSTVVFNAIGLDQEAGSTMADFGNNVVNFNTSANISGTVTTIAKK
jgi:hypothetical protein